GVATPPERDEGDQPDQRKDGIAHDAADRVKRSMERGHEKVRSQDYPGETKVDAGGGKDRAAEQPGPQPMTEGCQHATHQLGEDDRVEREKKLVPLTTKSDHRAEPAPLRPAKTKPNHAATTIPP